MLRMKITVPGLAILQLLLFYLPLPGYAADPVDAALPPERRLPLVNTLNSRDLGGYIGADGRQVRWGLLFRSDGLDRLDAADLEVLKALQLGTVTDFRSPAERALAPDRLPGGSQAPQYHTLGINNPAVDAAEIGRKLYAGELSQAEIATLLDRSAYITDPRLREAWGGWLRSLAEPGALPQLFHCTAGKDRTGFAAAIVLLALGVSREDVMDDFLLSNDYLEEKIEGGIKHIQAASTTQIAPVLLRQVLGVSPDSLEGALLAMEEEYGSVEAYLQQGLGLEDADLAKLRSLLLE